MTKSFRDNLVDELLILKAQQGSRKAMSKLIGRWHGPLTQYALKVTRNEHVAQDIVQETWVAVIERLITLREIEKFNRWVLRILNNKCRDHWRKEETHARHLDQQKSELRRHRVTVKDARGFDEIMEALDGPTRAILVMKYIHEMSVGEIAESLGVPEGTVKSRLYYARKRIKRNFERENIGKL